MAGTPRKKTTKQVDTLRHGDTRPNIPTAELADFAADHEKHPSTMLYPRDPSLDPQLVWQGKDEQDAADLAVPVVPIYIQEKIEPRVIIDDLRRDSSQREPEMSLFAQFDGVEPEHVLDFYHHGANWSNRMILGDSLLVMASLAEKEHLRGKVQMIYLDPPYGIEFRSNWQVSTRDRDVRDGEAKDLVRQPEQVKAFRDTWEKGIHSYLAYLRDRLVAARELLTESGSVFVQIGDANLHVVRSLMDEVFGTESFVVTIPFKKKGSQRSGYIDPVNDYLLWYTKEPRSARPGPKFRPLFAPRGYSGDVLRTFRLVEMPDGTITTISAVPAAETGELADLRLDPSRLARVAPGARLLTSENLTGGGVYRTQAVPFSWEGMTYSPKQGNSWKHSAITDDGALPGMARLGLAGRLLAAETTWRYRRYYDDFPFVALDNWWDNLGGAADPIYAVQTNTTVVERCILMTTDPGDLVLDPTCGSGTTAYAAEQWGRRWITIDTSRVAIALARTRLMSARYPWYLLTDSREGRLQEAEITHVPPADSPTGDDIKQGFVYKRALHITSTTIANNPDITEGMTREEIDAAIARHADQELLVDQPYEDNKRVRVTGRFTVESLSPHRVLDPEAVERTAAEVSAEQDPRREGYVPMILANLRKAGVQNRVKQERMTFDTLEPHAGEWIQGAATYTDATGETRRVAISVGPEHGTVGPLQVKEAAKEAVKGVGFDVLVVCGFAFDASVDQMVGQFGDLTILPTRMNPDLAMGDDLLKKTGAGNLFMVFGEPDIRIEVGKDGQVVAEVRGIDVYDPTTGEIRSDTVDDIAVWFIDTDYNGESFFVRHAYFTGADEPYDRLKKALKAEIDEEAWSTLYRTESRPFPKPSTGKIAVKVINHYGDEVMKVYEVG
ncbi:MAG: site-specific DNA-methyltransferase [Acidimicrobiia bacterium]|nr:MAG: site-specific DNA-methyltransferase [Acidimicrobiia bacterium]